VPLRMGGQYISSVDDVRARPPGGRVILGGELADAELAERYGLINRAQSLTVSPRFGGGSSLDARARPHPRLWRTLSVPARAPGHPGARAYGHVTDGVIP
jgi:hypothetical protein